MLKNKLKFILLLITVAVSAVAAWYAPTLFKGYSTLILRDSSLLARSYSQDNIYGIEDKLNITLVPSLVKEQAEISHEGNKLNSIVIGQIFKFFGLPKYEQLIFIPIAILAVALLIFTITVYYLFDFKTAAVFAFVYILLPINWWQAPYNFSTYEVGLLFISIFFLFYFIGLKSNSKYKYISTSLSGIFLALSGIAKEALLIIVPVLFIYLLIKKEGKYLIFLFVPFLIIISFFWLPDMISGKNSYLLIFKEQTNQEKADFLNWSYFSHLFPDPYTYHFDREAYLDKYQSDIYSSDLDLVTRITMTKTIAEMGVKSPSLVERFKIGINNLIRQVFRFLAIEEVGGPFIALLLILGFLFLRQENKYLYHFFVFWIVFVLFFVSFISMGVRSHLIDFGWVIALAAALGLLFLIDISAQYFRIEKRGKLIVGFLLFLLVLYNLILSGHVMWGRIYDEDKFLISSIYAEEVNKLDIADTDVIAIDIPGTERAKLNYLTSKSMVVFDPETIERLIKQNKLSEAFEKFRVKYILGYSPDLTNKILTRAQVKNITTNDIDLTLPEVSKTKSWLMNLIR